MRRPARQYRFVRRPFGPGETVVELKMVLSTPDETVSHIVDVDLSAFEGLAFGIGAREIIRSRIEVMLREACDHDIIELDA
jgi:hypothetical protein